MCVASAPGATAASTAAHANLTAKEETCIEEVSAGCPGMQRTVVVGLLCGWHTREGGARQGMRGECVKYCGLCEELGGWLGGD